MTAAAKKADRIMTPEERRERAAHSLSKAIRELVRAEVEQIAATKDYYDQTDSPLGRRKHVELARAGRIPATKYGRKWHVLKSDMHSFLEREGLARGTRIEDDDVDGIIETIVTGGRDE